MGNNLIQSKKNKINNLIITSNSYKLNTAKLSNDAVVAFTSDPSNHDFKGKTIDMPSEVHVDSQIYHRLYKALEYASGAKPSIERTLMLSRLPSIAEWGYILQNFCLNLETLMTNNSISRVTGYGLTDSFNAIVQSYCNYNKIPYKKYFRLKLGIRKNFYKFIKFANNLKLFSGAKPIFFGCQRPSSNCIKLLVSAWHINAVRAMLKICRQTHKAGHNVAFLIKCNDSISRKELRDNGVNYYCVEQFFSIKDLKDSYRMLEFLKQKLDNKILGIIIDAIKLPVWANSDQIANVLKQILLQNFIYNHLYAAGTLKAVHKLKPKGFVFLSQRIFHNEILKMVGKQVLKVYVQQGIIPFIPVYGDPMDVDAAIIGSELEMEYMKRCNIKQSKINIAGYPWYDKFKPLNKKKCREKTISEFNGSQFKHIVVYCSQYPTAVYPKWARDKQIITILEAAKRMLDTLFIIKLHPVKEPVPKKAGVLPLNVKITKHFDTFVLIKAADVMITYWSTTALEALLLDTPLLHLNVTSLPDFFDLSSRLGTDTVRNAGDLFDTLYKILRVPDYRKSFQSNVQKFMTSENICNDGNSGKRASDLIINLLSNYCSTEK